jgi:hypothetical protein
MRELAKSMMSYTWTMSMFGMQQAINLMTPMQGSGQCSKAAQAFDAVNEATCKTFDAGVRQAYQTGKSMQGGFIDMMFGAFMAGGCDPGRVMQMGVDAMRRMGGMGTQTAGTADPAASGPTSGTGDWGPMPR